MSAWKWTPSVTALGVFNRWRKPMFGLGPIELLVVVVVGLLTIGIPILTLVLVIVLVQRSSAAKRDELTDADGE